MCKPKHYKTLSALSVAAVLGTAPAAEAHFQLVYTPEVNLTRPAEVPLELIFWHPMENGYVMDMGKPIDFHYVLKGRKTDLTASLEPVTFHGAGNDAKAWKTSLKLKRNGDYIFALTPDPYFERSEDLYIQQIAKSFVNKGGVPTGWNEPLGLPAEIVPLNKPTNVIAGSTFSGVVLSEGKPVPGAEVEVEYLAAEPDLAADRPGPVTVSPPPGGALVAIADARGVFTFGLPRAGFWGFAALGVGPAKEHQGKPLSQDAVIWVRANALEANPQKGGVN